MLRTGVWSRLARLATCVSSGTIQAALEQEDEYIGSVSSVTSTRSEVSVIMHVISNCVSNPERADFAAEPQLGECARRWSRDSLSYRNLEGHL